MYGDIPFSEYYALNPTKPMHRTNRNLANIYMFIPISQSQVIRTNESEENDEPLRTNKKNSLFYLQYSLKLTNRI